MKTFIQLLILVMVATSLKAQYNKANLKVDALLSQNKYHYEKLQLYPIRANAAFVDRHKNVGTYTPLNKALAQHKVKISEISDGDVNSLFIENISNDTVIILSGEVVKGGKQDRMIAQDIVLHPKSGKKDVSVFCVEQGRWNSDGDMSFSGYFSISSNEVRKAGTVSKNQSNVWEKVAETTSKNNARTSTGTLTALQGSETFNGDLKRYSDHFSKVLITEPDVIGMIAVSGNKILGCDMFATHALFANHYAGLVNSFATEAITSGEPVIISDQKVKQYFEEITGDESRQEKEVEKKGTMLKDNDKKLHISTF